MNSYFSTECGLPKWRNCSLLSLSALLGLPLWPLARGALCEIMTKCAWQQSGLAVRNDDSPTTAAGVGSATISAIHYRCPMTRESIHKACKPLINLSTIVYVAIHSHLSRTTSTRPHSIFWLISRCTKDEVHVKSSRPPDPRPRIRCARHTTTTNT